MLQVTLKKNLPEFQLDIKFEINQEIMAILGPSGCGKTMTLRCIAGLMMPDEGYIVLDQQVLFDSKKKINLPARERRIGFLFQNYALFPHLTVYENIIFGIQGKSTEERHNRVEQLLYKMGLNRLGHRYPMQLSGGQQQRAALARALAPEPEVLLLDEPFSALDTIVKQRLEEELLEIQDYYHGHVLFVTHNLAEAYRLSDKIAIYEAGELLQWGERQTVIECPANKKVAYLTGMENIYDARIIEMGGKISLKLKGYSKTLTIQPENLRGIELNENCAAAIRPEYVKLNLNQKGSNCLPARLIDYTEELSFYNYRFKLEPQTGEQVIIKAFVPKPIASRLTPGEVYHLYLPPEKLVLMPLLK